MTANSDDQLDALVDFILQSRNRSAHTSQMPQQLPLPQHQQQPSNPASASSRSCGLTIDKTASTRHREHTSSDSSRNADNFVTAMPPDSHASAYASKTTPTRRDADDEEVGEEEDLNALIERILAVDGARGSPSTSGPMRHIQSPQRASPSVRARPSALSALSPNFSYLPPPQIGSSGPSSASRLGGATRMQGRSRSLPRMLGVRDASPSPCMQAVVRRLALWYECKEAKRVQAVYEALEREQQDCTFEPSINRFEVEPRSSLVADEECHPLHRHHHSADEALHRLSAPSKARDGSGSRPVSFANTTSMSSSSSRVTPQMCDYIPSLQPPLQPITGADAFVERLRRAQEKRDAVREAEEAKRLHYYDPTTFRRDITVPVPFELGGRPRRRLTETAGVVGARSHSPGGVVGVACASPPLPLEGGVFRDLYEGKRLTPENTFVSLAPKIRHTLLFDRQMESQLLRATESVRRAAGGE